MTNDYVTFYMHTAFAGKNPSFFLALLFLFLARVLPIVALAPFLGARLAPRPAKMGLALALFAVFIPQLTTRVEAPLDFNLDLLLYLGKEAFIGLLLGFIISLPFMIVQNVGILIDHQRGASSLMTNDPALQNQSSPTGTLFDFVLIYLFFMIEGPFLILDILSKSYNLLPPDQFLNPDFFNRESDVMTYVIGILGNVMILSTQLAAPALIMILMADFFLGIANRLAPQVQITFLGMPLKSFLAIVVVFMGWHLYNEETLRQVYRFINSLSFLIQNLKPVA